MKLGLYAALAAAVQASGTVQLPYQGLSDRPDDEGPPDYQIKDVKN